MRAPPEPKRITSISELWEPIQERVKAVLAAMKARGFDPIIYESRRTTERQAWLWGIGRAHHLNRKPVTDKDGVKKQSRHQVAKAVDVISKSRYWGWPAFFRALRQEAKKQGLHSLAPYEECHLEWR